MITTNIGQPTKRYLLLSICAMTVLLCCVLPAASQYLAANGGIVRPNTFTEGDRSNPSSNVASAIQKTRETSPYYWNSTPVGDSAQLLTLLCSACDVFNGTRRDVPLVSLLRDTLGDQSDENDRVTYVWLLSYTRPRLERRLLSAIPFFYWRIGQGSSSVGEHDTKPLMDLTAPERPMMAQIGRDLLQWAAFDPRIAPIRASTRAYRSNSLDDERLHLEEAISYLRHAPVSSDFSAPTQAQLDTAVARLQLRKTLLGGLADEKQAVRVGVETASEQERIRSRNWELLREWAEETGLFFEPLALGGKESHYAILWFPRKQSIEPKGSSLHSIWKLLGIRNPWSDERLKNWKGPVYQRTFDGNDSAEVIPLAVYSLDYPKLPLILVDFRDKLSGRRREMIQRSIVELTAGVIGISHFTNWYFYVGWDLYEFVEARHGKAVDEAARLDSYSDFRMDLALDEGIDPLLTKEMESRSRALEINPLEITPERAIQTAIARYQLLKAEAGENGRLNALIDQGRRYELASFGESKEAKAARSMLNVATLGVYRQHVKRDDIATLDRDRRVEYQLNLLDSLVEAETPPEIAYDSRLVESSVSELSRLMPTISSSRVRSHTETTLRDLKNLSKDTELQAECTTALAIIKQTGPSKNIEQPAVVAQSTDIVGADAAQNVERIK